MAVPDTITRSLQGAVSGALTPFLGLFSPVLDAMTKAVLDEVVKQAPRWGTDWASRTFKPGERVEAVLDSSPKRIRSGAVVEVRQVLYVHEELVVRFDDGEERTINPDIMRHHRFVKNGTDALLTSPECEDYCATCGKHKEEHRRGR